MRAVLDTNVFLSAILSPGGSPDRIYLAWLAKQFVLVSSSHQIDELRRVSRYAKLRPMLPPHRVGRIVNDLQRAIVLDKLRITEEADDPEDSFLLAMAVAGDADYLVTGDRRAGLLVRASIGRTRIVTPREFCEAIL